MGRDPHQHTRGSYQYRDCSANVVIRRRRSSGSLLSHPLVQDVHCRPRRYVPCSQYKGLALATARPYLSCLPTGISIETQLLHFLTFFFRYIWCVPNAYYYTARLVRSIRQ